MGQQETNGFEADGTRPPRRNATGAMDARTKAGCSCGLGNLAAPVSFRMADLPAHEGAALRPSRTHAVGRRGVSRRGFFSLSLALGAAALAVPASAEAQEEASTSSYPERPVTFCIMSDLHYFAPELWSDCADYAEAENSDRKMFRESASILAKALADVVAAKPDIVFVPGDLTKDGELVGHRGLHALFEGARAQLAAAGVTTTFLFINGNHDLNNHAALDFSSGSAQAAERTDPVAYKDLWREYGYEGAVVFDAGGTQDGSLSYVARPVPGLTVIAVDTCRYNEPSDDGSGLAQATAGRVGDALLKWVCNQAKQARAAGDVVVAMQHHGIVPHFGDEPTLMAEYLVEDYDRVARAYAEAGIACVFTGHMHANDIAAATYGDATVYDIETGSLVTYPSWMRTGSLAFTRSGANVEATLSVDIHDLGEAVLEGCGLPGTSQAITAYGAQRTLSVLSVQTMCAGMFVEPMLAQAAQAGARASVAQALGVEPAGLNAALWGMLAASGVLPTTREEGLHIAIGSSLAASVWLDAGAGRIRIDQVSAESLSATPLMNLSLSAAAEERLGQAPRAARADRVCLAYVDAASMSAFLDALWQALDAQVLAEPGRQQTVACAAEAVRLLLEAPVDDAHNVLALANAAYQAHLRGCEDIEAWTDQAIEAIGGAGLLGDAVAQAVNGTLASERVQTLATAIPLDIKALLQAGDIPLIGALVPGIVAGMVPHVGALLKLLAGDGTGAPAVDAGALVAGALPASLTQMVHSALFTLSHDDNVAQDHAFSFAAHAVDPDYSNGSGAGDGTGGDSDGGSGSDGDGGSDAGTGSGSGSAAGGSGTGGAGTGSGTGFGTGSGTDSNSGSGARHPSTERLPRTADEGAGRIAAAVLGGAAVLAAGVREALRPHEDAPAA